MRDPDEPAPGSSDEPDDIGPEGAPYDDPETEHIEDEGDPIGGNFA